MATVLILKDRVSIQAAIDVALRLYLDGRLDHQKYRDLMYGFSVAMRNFDLAGDTLAGPRPQQHDFIQYFSRVRGLLSSVDYPLIAAEEAALNAQSEGPQ